MRRALSALLALPAVLAVVPVADASPPPPCPPNLTATAQSDGSVVLTWDAVPGADGYNAYRDHDRRAVSPDDMLFQGHLTTTTMTDRNAPPGVVLTYQVLATSGEAQSEDCDTVQVTAIPEFPAGPALALACLGGLGAFALARRAR